jgi:hypothetical protein
MTSRREVLELVGSGLTYEQAAARLGRPAGLLYLIATGRPADGSDATTAAERERPGATSRSTQALCREAPAENPTSDGAVRRWMRSRALADQRVPGS